MRHQSYEATLLSRGRLDVALDEARRDLPEIVEDQGLILERLESIDGAYLLLDCGPVQVLIAFCSDPMLVMHFVNAGRPAEAMRSETDILILLHRHRATATVLVTDTPGETSPDPRLDVQKRMLCADLTDWLFTRTTPDLVFWCDTDTLFAAPEFDRESTRAALGQHSCESHAPVQLHADPPVRDMTPDLTGAAGTPETESPRPPAQTPGEMMVEAVLAVGLPTWATIRLAKLQDSWQPREVVKQATRACTVCTLSMLGVANYGGPLL